MIKVRSNNLWRSHLGKIKQTWINYLLYIKYFAGHMYIYCHKWWTRNFKSHNHHITTKPPCFCHGTYFDSFSILWTCNLRSHSSTYWAYTKCTLQSTVKEKKKLMISVSGGKVFVVKELFSFFFVRFHSQHFWAI